ncbi:Psi-producing oxygenase A [Cladorrhinum samala]|uniref:Psi-producing oxygenase A n=1 Tax=Cladorrhinum samala TaxID=585594 RepID=A0AAV9HI81_9PEZI|nr:Psi-producing oxygenase A [Cladorrhinum samala]
MAGNKFEEKYLPGDSYGDEETHEGEGYSLDKPIELAAGLFKELTSVGKEVSLVEITKVIQAVTTKPLDDKAGGTEILIGLLTSLSSRSKIRKLLTDHLIDSLWDTLQHPPLTYVGGDVKYEVVDPANPDPAKPKRSDTITFTSPDNPNITLRESVPQAPDGLYQYRTPDGSYNSMLHPHLGRAGTPYAKSVRGVKRLQGVKPDPGLLFDLLMARDDSKNIENDAGISAMFYYHATIIIHDIFRTNRQDQNISDTSSYLDLAPLYGSSLKDQLEIRTMKEGKLKPDTFSEKRLLGQPPGVNVMLVLYNRFHNYVADVLLKINENGRFTLGCAADADPETRAKAIAKQDHDLFNVARLIVGGLYINIALHDYLRAITNTHASNSDWTLDPRVDIEAQKFDDQGTPRGVGNQVSVEFNLLYRFHSMISKRDEKWTNEFFLHLLPHRKQEDLEKITWEELGYAIMQYEKKIPTDPSKREFGGLKRDSATGKFDDKDLVRLLKESMDDPACVFGARTVPKVLRTVEILGIGQARKWQVASLNEFREFFGLKRHETFEDINSDPDIAGILEKLYTDPDMVELYPGLMIENAKPMRKTGCGIRPTYSLGRAVLSDAITLVRSDRFNTLDYTVSNLTSWGYNEVQYDNKTLGGSMLYKLIQRGLPGWFPFNSVAVMQPMYTKQANAKIAESLGTITQFSLADPVPPRNRIPISTASGIKTALSTPDLVPSYLPAFATLGTPGNNKTLKSLSSYSPATLNAILENHASSLPAAVSSLVQSEGAALLEKESFPLRKNALYQLDILRDLAIPLTARFLADLFYLDLRSDENTDGKLSATEVYRSLVDIHVWGLDGLTDDAANAWNRRRKAQEGLNLLAQTTEGLVKEVAGGMGLLGSAKLLVLGWDDEIKNGGVRSIGWKVVQELLNRQKSDIAKVVDHLWVGASVGAIGGGAGGLVRAFTKILEFFLKKENENVWNEVKVRVEKGEDVSPYVVEAVRITSEYRETRVATNAEAIEGQKVEKDDFVLLKTGDAGRDGSKVPEADKFNVNRKNDYVTASTTTGNKDVAVVFVTELIKFVAGLKNLRPAPGEMGNIKSIRLGSDSREYFLNDTWSHLSFDPSSKCLSFQGIKVISSNFTFNSLEGALRWSCIGQLVRLEFFMGRLLQLQAYHLDDVNLGTWMTLTTVDTFYTFLSNTLISLFDKTEKLGLVFFFGGGGGGYAGVYFFKKI